MFTWRHDKVLNQIQSQVAYHLDKQVNIPKSSVSLQSSTIWFVSAEAKVKGPPKCQNRSGMGILTEAKNWVLLAVKRLKSVKRLKYILYHLYR